MNIEYAQAVQRYQRRHYLTSIKPIRTKADYQQTLARIESIFDAASGTPEFNELDALAMLAEAYETTRYYIPDPVD